MIKFKLQVMALCQGNRCFYCGKLMNWNVAEHNRERPTLDHFIPKSWKWRQSRMHQYHVAACHGCNTKQGARKRTQAERENLSRLNANRKHIITNFTSLPADDLMEMAIELYLRGHEKDIAPTSAGNN